MMLVNTIVKRSPIHGLGIFAVESIAAGTRLYQFRKHEDFKIPLARADDEELHFGYVNPQTPEKLSICGDQARYWNFGLDCLPNAVEGDEVVNGEKVIVAARDIAEGEELLISTASDLDADRKLGLVSTTLIPN